MSTSPLGSLTVQLCVSDMQTNLVLLVLDVLVPRGDDVAADGSILLRIVIVTVCSISREPQYVDASFACPASNVQVRPVVEWRSLIKAVCHPSERGLCTNQA